MHILKLDQMFNLEKPRGINYETKPKTNQINRILYDREKGVYIFVDALNLISIFSC